MYFACLFRNIFKIICLSFYDENRSPNFGLKSFVLSISNFLKKHLFKWRNFTILRMKTSANFEILKMSQIVETYPRKTKKVADMYFFNYFPSNNVCEQIGLLHCGWGSNLQLQRSYNL